jgi:hypothetical protein
MPPPTYVSFLRERLEEASPTNLEDYLRAISSEDWQAEFKSAVNDAADFQLRKAVASLANREGGELFIGVTDSDRRLVGTPLDKDTLYRRLTQEGSRGDWYVLDLSPLVDRTTEVGLSTGPQRILVCEIRKAVLPGLVVDKDRGPLWFERRGRSDHELTSYEAVEARRRFLRGKYLLELFTELQTAVGSIPDFVQGDPLAAGARHFRLPRFAALLSDGSIYSILEERDRALLLATPAAKGGYSAPGILQRFLDAGVSLDETAARYGPEYNLYNAVSNDLRSARHTQEASVGQFRDHLRSLGMLSVT